MFIEITPTLDCKALNLQSETTESRLLVASSSQPPHGLAHPRSASSTESPVPKPHGPKHTTSPWTCGRGLSIYSLSIVRVYFSSGSFSAPENRRVSARDCNYPKEVSGSAPRPRCIRASSFRAARNLPDLLKQWLRWILARSSPRPGTSFTAEVSTPMAPFNQRPC